MSSWSTRRQLTFVFSFILILLIIVASIIFFSWEKPSCFDNKQNQDELEIDCGGPCLEVCPSEATDLIVHWSRVFPVREGIYDLAILIENPNSFGLLGVPYTVKIHDEDNILIREIKGSTYLNPGEKTIIFEPHVNVGFRTPTTAFVDFDSDLEWLRLQPSQKPVLTVSSKQVSTSSQGEVRVDLINNSLNPVQDIELYVLVADENKNVFAVSATTLDEMATGEERELFFTWPTPFSKEPASVEILMRVDLVSSYLPVEE